MAFSNRVPASVRDAAAAAEEEEEQEEKGELERRAETLEIGTPGERTKLRSQDPKARRRAQKLISQVRDCALAPPAVFLFPSDCVSTSISRHPGYRKSW